MLVLAVMKSSVARCRMWSRLTERWWSKSKSSIVLRAGNPAARIRFCRAVGAAGGDFGLEAGGEVFLVGPAASRAAAASRSAESRSAGAFRTRAR